MNNIIEKIYQDGFVEDEQKNQFDISTSAVKRDAGSVLYHVIKDYKPKRTLEVGMAYGLSTLHICQALAENGEGLHTAIDPYQEIDYKSIGLLNVKRAELDQLLTFHQRPSHHALAEFDAKNQNFDFAFIDGSHLFDYVLTDFLIADRILDVSGILVFDDLWMPSVRKAISFVLRNRNYRIIKPSNRVKPPFFLRILRIGRRILQNPFGRDWRLKFIPQNVIILQKVDNDDRHWTHHRNF
jgi:predicted O-methyltransferase YrrM